MDIFMGKHPDRNNAQTPLHTIILGGGISPLLPLGANGITKNGTTHGRYGRELSTYMDDMTALLPLKAAEIAYHAHQVSIDIHNKIWETAKPNSCSDHLLAEKDEKKSIEPYFMGTRSTGSTIGHGVGLK